MNEREQFEAWASEHFRVHKANIDYFLPSAWETWQASRRTALEEAAEIAYQYEEGSGGAEAIRALKDKDA